MPATMSGLSRTGPVRSGRHGPYGDGQQRRIEHLQNEVRMTRLRTSTYLAYPLPLLPSAATCLPPLLFRDAKGRQSLASFSQWFTCRRDAAGSASPTGVHGASRRRRRLHRYVRQCVKERKKKTRDTIRLCSIRFGWSGVTSQQQYTRVGFERYRGPFVALVFSEIRRR